MKLSYRVLALVGLAFSIFIAATALDLRLMTRLGPGPGFFPFSLAVLFGLLSVGLYFKAGAIAKLATGDGDPEPRDRPAEIAVLLLVTTLTVSAVFFEYLGFCLSMLGFCIAALLIMGERRWYVIAPTALIGSFGVYFLFVHYLGVSLPEGLISI